MNNKNFEHLYFMQKCPLFGIFQVTHYKSYCNGCQHENMALLLGPQHLATVKTPEEV